VEDSAIHYKPTKFLAIKAYRAYHASMSKDVLAKSGTLFWKVSGGFVNRRALPSLACGHEAFTLEHGKLIIFQHRKQMGEFFQAGCELITPLVGKKYR
jgi:hypothetical protein